MVKKRCNCRKTCDPVLLVKECENAFEGAGPISAGGPFFVCRSGDRVKSHTIAWRGDRSERRRPHQRFRNEAFPRPRFGRNASAPGGMSTPGLPQAPIDRPLVGRYVLGIGLGKPQWAAPRRGVDPWNGSRPTHDPPGRSSAWLERLVRDQEVAGSNPVAPIILQS